MKFYFIWAKFFSFRLKKIQTTLALEITDMVPKKSNKNNKYSNGYLKIQVSIIYVYYTYIWKENKLPKC